jgi:hypothetical protein
MAADAVDEVGPAPAESLADVRGDPGQDGGRQAEQQRAVQGRGELGGQDVQVGAAEAHLSEQPQLGVADRQGGRPLI